MNFVHDEPGFASLLTQVADQTRIAPALVEKDYWITHALWALHETGLDLWFKGGTSLSKGFGIIERFSEDLDLMVEPGRVTALPDVSSWSSPNKGPVAQRQAFYRALAEAFTIPAVPVDRDATREDKHGRGADYLGRYPGVFVAHLPGAMSPSVRFEVGRARVVPFVERPVTLGDGWIPLRPILTVMRWMGKAPAVSVLRRDRVLERIGTAGFVDVTLTDVGADSTIT